MHAFSIRYSNKIKIDTIILYFNNNTMELRLDKYNNKNRAITYQ